MLCTYDARDSLFTRKNWYSFIIQPFKYIITLLVKGLLGREDHFDVLFVKISPVLRKWEPKSLGPLNYEMDYGIDTIVNTAW